MVKIGIFTWGTGGDILPFISLAKGLAAAGYQVELMVGSADGKDYSFASDEKGIAFTPLDTYLSDYQSIFRDLGRIRSPGQQIKAMLERMILPFDDLLYSSSERLCANHDIVIGHIGLYHLATAAEVARKPYISVTLAPLACTSRIEPIPGVPHFGKFFNGLLWKGLSLFFDHYYGKFINDLRVAKGLPKERNMLDSSKKDLLCLVATSPTILTRPSDWPENIQVSGHIPSDKTNFCLDQSTKDFLDSGDPPIFLGFGSMAVMDPVEDRELMLQVATILSRRVIIQSPLDAPSNLPGSIHMVKQIDHSTVLPHCALMVMHGGAGTTHQVLEAGIPSVVVYFGADQIMWGGLLYQKKLSSRAIKRSKATPKRVASTILQVLADNKIAAAVKEAKIKIDREDGIATAINLIDKAIEKWKNGGHPP